MTDSEMKLLIDAIMKAQFEADSFSDDEATHATPHRPATEEEIAAFERELRGRGIPIPPSFVQFLRIHNGIDNFIPSMELSLRSAEQISESEEHDSGWGDMSSACRFVFAAGESGAFAGFLPETANQAGEMAVIMFNDLGEPTRYQDFDDFLKDQLAYYESVIRAETADRADLEND